MGEMELNYLLIVPLNGDPIQVGFHIENTILQINANKYLELPLPG
jgi:hypothetical protein